MPEDQRRPRRRDGRRFFARRKVCAFCVEKVQEINYRDVGRLRRYVSELAKIDPRRKTGTCARHQRDLAHAIKRARHLGLLPYTPDHVRAVASARAMAGGVAPRAAAPVPKSEAPVARPDAAPAAAAEPGPSSAEASPTEREESAPAPAGS